MPPPPPALPSVPASAAIASGDADAAALASWLAAHDSPCPVCNYNLRALTVPRCPECSTRLFLTVGSDDLALGPFLLAVISLAMGMGFDGVVFTLMTVMTILNPPPSVGTFVPIATIGGLFLGAAILCGGGVTLLALRRRRWRRLPRRRQWAAAVAIFTAVALGHGAFGLALAASLN